MLPRLAAATVEAERTSNWRRVSSPCLFPRIAIAIRHVSVESRRKMPAQHDSWPKVLRQADDSAREEQVAEKLTPVADAAGPAGPGLNARILGLVAERLATTLHAR